jgi:hypothetical protein
MARMPITGKKMLKIIHRVNTTESLKKIPEKYGVEIDIRGYGGKLLLNHDPIDDPAKYDELEEYLKNFRHAFIIFNMKEAGYEQRVLDLAEKYSIENFFLLDVEFPYLYHATRKKGVRKIAVRYSEAEPIESVLAQSAGGKPLLDWVWIDTNTQLPLNKKIIGKFKELGLKTCLVCPERWGRPEDIKNYKEFMEKEGIIVDAVMTSLETVNEW